jgi:hypothetical protein
MRWRPSANNADGAALRRNLSRRPRCPPRANTARQSTNRSSTDDFKTAGTLDANPPSGVWALLNWWVLLGCQSRPLE